VNALPESDADGGKEEPDGDGRAWRRWQWWTAQKEQIKNAVVDNKKMNL
jgi:hypothetical protein